MGVDEQLAFDELREILASDVIVIHPDWTLPFIMQMDACNDGISAVLSQRDKNGVEHIGLC